MCVRVCACCASVFFCVFVFLVPRRTAPAVDPSRSTSSQADSDSHLAFNLRESLLEPLARIDASNLPSSDNINTDVDLDAGLDAPRPPSHEGQARQALHRGGMEGANGSVGRQGAAGQTSLQRQQLPKVVQDELARDMAVLADLREQVEVLRSMAWSDSSVTGSSAVIPLDATAQAIPASPVAACGEGEGRRGRSSASPALGDLSPSRLPPTPLAPGREDRHTPSPPAAGSHHETGTLPSSKPDATCSSPLHRPTATRAPSNDEFMPVLSPLPASPSPTDDDGAPMRYAATPVFSPGFGAGSREGSHTDT